MTNLKPFPKFPAFSSDAVRKFYLIPISSVSRWFNDLQLQYKIGWSFGLAISIAIVGVTTGWIVAEAYLEEARADIEDSEAEYRMLNELKVNLLRMHLHQKGAILTLNDLPQWTEVYATFIEDREKFRSVWQNYKDNQGIVHGDTIYDQRERELIADLTVIYSVFAKDLDSLIAKLGQAELAQLSDDERRDLQTELTRFNNQALRQDAYRFLSLVQELSDNADIQIRQAKLVFDKAAVFRLQVIIISSLASLIIAVVLLFLLSRAISFSVKNAAKTAEQVIETSNFDLQVPVTSSDEVGTLSAALNRLIAQVKQLLQQEKEKTESLKKALCEIQS
ncbi:MAG: cell wall metabolism sensor histidine kinase WalK, partial [Leptolyngbya sp. SIO3F4]|nr:cell wall metabolism sensor histidine kinase WalK [Leptolyngbya sp. SIO3F4]